MKSLRASALFLLAAGACASGPAVFVVEEHQEAWAVWEELRARGLGPGATLVHLDAHEDLGAPGLREPLPDPVAPGEARRLVREELSVDDVVVPALFTGTVGELVWVVPPWLEAEPPRELRRWVGSLGGGRRELVVRRTPSPEELPDGRPFRTLVVRLPDLPAPLRAPVLLDIDLDYFACENAHAAHRDEEITREEHERLLEENEVWMQGRSEESGTTTRSAVLRRPPGTFRWPVRVDRVRDRRTGALRYVRGCVCMGLYRDAFPVHRPDEEEVGMRIAELERVLADRRIEPAAITIARSAHSGFVLPGRADSLEGRVLAALRRVYPALGVVRR